MNEMRYDYWNPEMEPPTDEDGDMDSYGRHWEVTEEIDTDNAILEGDWMPDYKDLLLARMAEHAQYILAIVVEGGYMIEEDLEHVVGLTTALKDFKEMSAGQ